MANAQDNFLLRQTNEPSRSTRVSASLHCLMELELWLSTSERLKFVLVLFLVLTQTHLEHGMPNIRLNTPMWTHRCGARIHRSWLSATVLISASTYFRPLSNTPTIILLFSYLSATENIFVILRHDWLQKQKELWKGAWHHKCDFLNTYNILMCAKFSTALDEQHLQHSTCKAYRTLEDTSKHGQRYIGNTWIGWPIVSYQI